MKIDQARKFGYSELRKSPSPDIDTEILLMWILKKEKSYLFANPNQNLNTIQNNKFLKLIDKRKQHWPIAYLIHKKEFYDLNFYVNQYTLIPRPETEQVVDRALKTIKKLSTNKNSLTTILDVGTGSGCISISIAKNINLPIKIIASDICKKALKVARKNASFHKIQIKFIQSDLLDKINEKPDIIVANLPYITPLVYSKLEPEITTFEPQKALLANTRNYYYLKLKQELKKRNWNPVLIFE